MNYYRMKLRTCSEKFTVFGGWRFKVVYFCVHVYMHTHMSVEGNWIWLIRGFILVLSDWLIHQFLGYWFFFKKGRGGEYLVWRLCLSLWPSMSGWTILYIVMRFHIEALYKNCQASMSSVESSSVTVTLYLRA